MHIINFLVCRTGSENELTDWSQTLEFKIAFDVLVLTIALDHL